MRRGRNVVTGSPISDINPLYMAAGSVFTVGGEGTPTRKVGLSDIGPLLHPFPGACGPISASLPWLCSAVFVF